jgi:SAM-dependent methyltransferase
MNASRIEQPADLDVVRTSYDRVADNYVEMNLGDITTYPWLRTAIDGFAAAVDGLGPVLDVGCGPGAVTAYLAKRGLDVSGVDLSARMIDHARRLHPDQRFDVASATDLNLAGHRRPIPETCTPAQAQATRIDKSSPALATRTRGAGRMGPGLRPVRTADGNGICSTRQPVRV